MKRRLEVGLVVVVGSKRNTEFWVDIARDIYDNEEGRALLREFLAPGEGLDCPVDPSLPRDADQRFRIVLKAWKVPRRLPGFTPGRRPDVWLPQFDTCPTDTEVWDAMMSYAAEKHFLIDKLQNA